MKEFIKDTKVVMLDLDGTVYLEGELIGDVIGTLNYLRNKGVQVVYLTNNSSGTDDAYYAKLKKMGVWDDRDIFYSSLDAAIDYLKMYHEDKSVYPVATDSVRKHIENCGIRTTEEADIVLLTFDKELTYEKLVIANRLIVKGALYISTHPDATCPAKDVFIPDAGSFISLFKTSSGKEPDIIIGKPYSVMADMLSTRLGVDKSKITMVGDRLHTDIKFGTDNGLNTALVLSGETTMEIAKVHTVKPDIIIDDINQLKNLI